jgi:hypothetical protein
MRRTASPIDVSGVIVITCGVIASLALITNLPNLVAQVLVIDETFFFHRARPALSQVNLGIACAGRFSFLLIRIKVLGKN